VIVPFASGNAGRQPALKASNAFTRELDHVLFGHVDPLSVRGLLAAVGSTSTHGQAAPAMPSSGYSYASGCEEINWPPA